MSVLLDTTVGDIVIDLLTDFAPRTCLNFLKLCKVKYYNFSPVYNVQQGFSCQTGDPIGPTGDGGTSIWGLIGGQKYFSAERNNLKHSSLGTVSMVVDLPDAPDEAKCGSQFLITLGQDLEFLDGKHVIFGRVAEGFEALDRINEAYCDKNGLPYKDIRIKHTIVLEDPFEDPAGLVEPPESPVPSRAQLATVRIGEDESLEDDVDPETAENLRRQREARAQALTLEMVGDLPFADMRPPENVLFVCKLNPVTSEEDLELIFTRFGRVLSCQIIRDKKTGDSLQYAFVEFETKEACEQAYFKMQDVLIDDHRIHVDFSQGIVRNWKDRSDPSRINMNKPRSSHRLPSHGPSLSGRPDQSRSYGGRDHDYVFDRESETRIGQDFGRHRHRSRSPSRYDSYDRRHRHRNNRGRDYHDDRSQSSYYHDHRDSNDHQRGNGDHGSRATRPRENYKRKGLEDDRYRGSSDSRPYDDHYRSSSYEDRRNRF